MSYNLLITLRQKSVIVTLYPHSPDGPLHFTVVKKFVKEDPCSWEENGLSWSGGNFLRYTITPTVPNGDGGYQYLLILDFVLTHNVGKQENIVFDSEGINYFAYSDTSLIYTMFGNYAFYYLTKFKGDVSSNRYWSLRKALPYPILE